MFVLETDFETWPLLMAWPDLPLKPDGVFGLVFRHLRAWLRDLMIQRGGQFFAVVGEDLRIVRSARNGDIRHPAVDQVFCAQPSIYVNQCPAGGLSLAGMTRDRIAMIQMRMPVR